MRPLICAGLLLVVTSGTAWSQTQMNLLVIQTDEHNFRTLGCYRGVMEDEQAFVWGPQAEVQTPHIDSLAREGALCTSFYATSPVCTPSRASFFTGLYPHNTGAPQNNLPMRNEVVTFAEVLRSQGYATGYAGKWHLDGNGKPQWAPSRQFGFEDNRFMFNRGHWKKFELTESGPRVAARNKGEPTYALDGANSETFSADWLTSRAIDFVREHANEPFCFHLSLPDPHGPNSVRPPYDTMYTDMVIKPPLTFSRTQDNPAWGTAQGKNGAGRFRADLMTQYFGMVKCIDDNVGRILKVLDELQISQRTAIVFTSDHGDLCFEHGRLNKGNPYEGSAKIPMILRVPGRIAPGTRINQALGTVDFAPTILQLLESEVTPAMEGRDFSSFARGKHPAWKDVAILRNGGVQPNWMAAVSDRFKLVVATNEVPWLFDLEQDPDELVNAFAYAEHREVKSQLAQALLEYGEQREDPFLTKPKVLKQQLEAMLEDK